MIFVIFPLLLLTYFIYLFHFCLSCVFLLGFILSGTLCASWTWLTISFPTLVKFSAIISSNIFSGPFSLPSPFGTPVMRMLVHLSCPRDLLGCLYFFSFFYILFYNNDFHHFAFQVIYPFHLSRIYLVPSSGTQSYFLFWLAFCDCGTRSGSYGIVVLVPSGG